jgi:hypothetical protein
MSNAITLIVATDKVNRDPDQIWCSVSIDLDRPAGRVVPLYGSRLTTGIHRQFGAGVLVVNAVSYDELFTKLVPQVGKSITANELGNHTPPTGLALPFRDKKAVPCSYSSI